MARLAPSIVAIGCPSDRPPTRRSDRLWERSVQRNLILSSLPGDRSYTGRLIPLPEAHVAVIGSVFHCHVLCLLIASAFASDSAQDSINRKGGTP
jgi:hypothetical protein